MQSETRPYSRMIALILYGSGFFTGMGGGGGGGGGKGGGVREEGGTVISASAVSY